MQKLRLIGFVVAFVALHAFLKQRGSAPKPSAAPGASVASTLASVGGPADEVAKIAQGNRLTVVAFFETWCVPCKQELPQLAKLYRERQGEGLAVVGVYGPSSVDVSSFAESLDITFPTVADPSGALAGVFGVDVVPTSLVLDAQLQVMADARGFKPAFVTEVSALLDGQHRP